MTAIDIFSLIVLLILVLTVLGLVVFLGLLPGKVAHQRQHPQTDAITIGSWVTLLVGGVLWPLVLIWAYMKPVASTTNSNSRDASAAPLKARIKKLESRLTELENNKSIPEEQL